MSRFSLFGSCLVGAVLGLGVPMQALSDQLYRWIDQNGVTHFSDAAPPSDATAVQSTPRPVYMAVEPDENYFSIINQSRRLEQRRLEREQARAARELARAERQRALVETERAAAAARLAAARSGDAESSADASATYLVPYQSSRHRFGHRAVPPLRPGQAVLESSVMRPRYEMQYGQRQFTGIERTTVTRKLGKP